MKKLILGLLLIFSFSYGSENRHLTQRNDIITLTNSYARTYYDLYPKQSKKVIRNVLQPYEETYGSKSLMSISMCMALFKVEFFDTLTKCETDDLHTFFRIIDRLDKLDKDYGDIALKVTTSFGIALLEILEYELKEMEDENKNKKRI